MTVENVRGSNLKHVATLIAAVAALVTACASFYRKPPEEDAKTAYDTLSKELEKVSGDTSRNHDDVVALHNFLEGFMRAKEIPVVDAGTPSAVAPLPAPVTPTSHTALWGGSAKPAASSRPAVVALPPPSPAPTMYRAPSFAAVKADHAAD